MKREFVQPRARQNSEFTCAMPVGSAKRVKSSLLHVKRKCNIINVTKPFTVKQETFVKI